MKSTKLFTKESKTLIFETLKQNWIISLFFFLAYFLSGILPIIINERNSNDISYFIGMILNNNHGFYSIIDCMFPVLIALSVFNYLHSKPSCLFTHSLPLSRTNILASNVKAGFILIYIPIIFIGLNLLTISFIFNMTTLITLKGVLIWFIRSLINVTFVYSISVFSAVISGSTFVQLFLSCFLNSCVFLISILNSSYNNTFLKGHINDLSMNSLYCSPVSYNYLEAGKGLNIAYLIYIFIAIAFITISFLLYKKVKLEREENGMTFSIAADILSILIAFIGTSIIALAFSIINFNNTRIFIITALIGSIISIILARIIVEKKLSVITKRNLIIYAISLIISLGFFSFSVFDITGFEKTIPEKDEVSSIEVNLENFNCTLTESQSIDDVLALHQELIINNEHTSTTEQLLLTYKLKDNSYISRLYYIPGDNVPSLGTAINKFFQGDEFKTKTKITEEDIDKISEVLLFNHIDGKEDTIPNNLYSGLIKAYNKDFENLSFDEYFNNEITTSDLSISFKEMDKNLNTQKYIYFNLSEYCESTIDFLHENGYHINIDKNIEEEGILID